MNTVYFFFPSYHHPYLHDLIWLEGRVNFGQSSCISSNFRLWWIWKAISCYCQLGRALGLPLNWSQQAVLWGPVGSSGKFNGGFTLMQKKERKKKAWESCDYMNGKIKNYPFSQIPSETGLKLAFCLCCVTLSERWCNKNLISTLNYMTLVYGLKYFTLLTVSECFHSNLFPTRAQSPPETEHVQFWFIYTKDQKKSWEEKVPARSPVYCIDQTRMWLCVFSEAYLNCYARQDSQFM